MLGNLEMAVLSRVGRKRKFRGRKLGRVAEVAARNLIRVMVLGILGLIRSNYHVVALQAALNETGPDARG